MKRIGEIKKYICMLFLTSAMIYGLTACQSAGEEKEEQLMGSITTIEDSTITVSVMGGGAFSFGMFGANMPEGEMKWDIPEGEMPEGFTPGNLPQGQAPSRENFEGMEKGNIPEGFNPGNMFGGETREIKVTKKTKITVNGEKATLADLNVGDFIQFTMNGEAATSINSGMMQFFSK